jgi:TRAP-type C4-dicarboxylate transport system substrate-binding protein
MHEIKHEIKNGWKTVVALTAAAVLATSGCQAQDRAGGQADVEVKELTFATTSDAPPQVKAWANEVDQLSKGTLKITFVKDARAGQPKFEAGTIADVRAGTVDMAWVGARAFDQAGVTSFQALVAPLLIDNLELQGKVFDAGIPQEMLSGLGKLDLVGIGVLPGPMRKVLGIRKPFTKPGDFTGAVVGIQDSGVADQTFHALGATAKPVPAAAKLDGLDAYDQQLSAIHGNQYAADAKYVTGNLNLWPRPLVIIANHAAYDRLTADQHDIMAAAAKDAVQVAMESERAADTNAGAALCKAGLTFAQSSDADLKAFEKALAPVYATIRNDPATAAWLDRIAGIKQSLHRAPDGADCSNVPDDQQQASRYDGTYQMSVVWPKAKGANARCVGGAEAGPEGAIYDMVFEKGIVRIWVRVGGPDAERELGLELPYQFFKDQLVITGNDGSKITVDFTYKDGKLTLANPRGGECGDWAIMTTKPWIRQ